IPEPYGKGAAITFNFYKDDAATIEIWKTGKTPPPYLTRQFTAGKLPPRDVQGDALPAASDAQAAAAKTVLADVQERLHLGLYGKASELFSTDWGVAENAPIRDWFRKRVFPKDPSQFTWDAARLQQFEPREVRTN